MVRFLILPTRSSQKLNLFLDARFDKTEQALVACDWTRLVYSPHPIIILGRDQGSLRRFLQISRRSLTRSIIRRIRPLDTTRLFHVR